MSKTGHAFIKERMRQENAIYGGEMSAHHYFRDFAYCDSGMIPWLLITEMLCILQKPLHELVEAQIAAFPASGEINYRVKNIETVIERIKQNYAGLAKDVNYTDGLSMAFEEWRFNLRGSNTEPVLRLNVESRADIGLMRQKMTELTMLIQGKE